MIHTRQKKHLEDYSQVHEKLHNSGIEQMPIEKPDEQSFYQLLHQNLNFADNPVQENQMQDVNGNSDAILRQIQQTDDINHSTLLWVRMMVWIYNLMDGEQKLKQIKYGLSESELLNKFLSIVEQMIIKNKQNQHITNKNNINCKELLNDCKKQLMDKLEKVTKLLTLIDLLDKQNGMVINGNKNQNVTEKHMKIDGEIDKKSEISQQISSQKSLQNSRLTDIITALQNELIQLKKPINPQSQTQIIKDNIQKKKLLQQNQILSNEVMQLKKQNKQLNKIIKTAKRINEEFLKVTQTFNNKNSSVKLTKQQELLQPHQIQQNNLFQKKSDCHLFKKKLATSTQQQQ